MDGSFLKQLEEIKKAKHARQYPNILEAACIEYDIIHKFIRPRTQWQS